MVGDLKNTCVDPRLEAGPPSSTAPYILFLKTDQSFIVYAGHPFIISQNILQCIKFSSACDIGYFLPKKKVKLFSLNFH